MYVLWNGSTLSFVQVRVDLRLGELCISSGGRCFIALPAVHFLLYNEYTCKKQLALFTCNYLLNLQYAMVLHQLSSHYNRSNTGSIVFDFSVCPSVCRPSETLCMAFCAANSSKSFQRPDTKLVLYKSPWWVACHRSFNFPMLSISSSEMASENRHFILHCVYFVHDQSWMYNVDGYFIELRIVDHLVFPCSRHLCRKWRWKLAILRIFAIFVFCMSL